MSEFGNNTFKDLAFSAEEELQLHPNSPYQFFKTRIYGRLHFVKRVRPEKASDPVYAAALVKEFEIGYTLEHPHIVKYLRYENGSVYQEYVDGNSLDMLLESDDPCFKDHATALRILSEILDALGYMHSNGIAYLDLKPQNIMLTRIGKSVRIVDLGSCVSGMYDLTPGFTREYASPEQLEDRPADARSDLYQFGLLARELFDRCGLYKEYNDFIVKCTTVDPANRFQDANAALEALTTHVNQRKSKRRRTIYGIIAVISLVALFSAYLLLDNNRRHNLENTLNNTNSVDMTGALQGQRADSTSAPNNSNVIDGDVDHCTTASRDPAATGAEVTDDDSNWSVHGYFTDIRIPPEGHPRRKEVMHTILEKSIDLDVSTRYSDALHGLISKYKSRGLSYYTLEGKSKSDFDHKLDSLESMIKGVAQRDAAENQYEGATADEVIHMFTRSIKKNRKDAVNFKL